MSNEHYPDFLQLRMQLGILDKALAAELGISTRALTERVTGRAVVKRETILALRHLIQERENARLQSIK
jgi:plasmid maintenance system antidote protein VapI